MIRIKIFHYDEISELSDLIDNYTFKPFSYYSKLNPEILTNYLSLDIQNIVSTNENYVIGLVENMKIGAFCALKKSDTESELLQKRIFSLPYLVSDGSYTTKLKNKMKLLRFLKSSVKPCVDMLSCRTNTNDISTIHALEKQSFRYMDSLVTYSFELPQRTAKSPNPFCTIRLSQNQDLKKLKEIAKKSFSIDRYHNDPKIPTDKSDMMYARFVEDATKGIGADKILVAEHENDVIGFNTIELQNHLLAQFGIRIGSFVLNAVSSDWRNRGVYSSLINDSLIYLNTSADLVEIRVHTNNYPVHRALPRLGFKLTMSQLTFHRWNSSTIGST